MFNWLFTRPPHPWSGKTLLPDPPLHCDRMSWYGGGFQVICERVDDKWLLTYTPSNGLALQVECASLPGVKFLREEQRDGD